MQHFCHPLRGVRVVFFRGTRRWERIAPPDTENSCRQAQTRRAPDAKCFLAEVASAKQTGRGSFPGYDGAVGKPVEEAIKVITIKTKTYLRNNRYMQIYVFLEIMLIREFPDIRVTHADFAGDLIMRAIVATCSARCGCYALTFMGLRDRGSSRLAFRGQGLLRCREDGYGFIQNTQPIRGVWTWTQFSMSQ